MPDIVWSQMKGLDELQKKLEEMATKDARLAVRIALNAGASEVKKAAQEEAPVEAEGENSGFLKDHINIKVRMKGPIAGTAFIGPSTAAYPNEAKSRIKFRSLIGQGSESHLWQRRSLPRRLAGSWNTARRKWQRIRG